MKPARLKAIGHGPQTSDIKVICVDCGKVRWYHPTVAANNKSGRCSSCAAKARKVTFGKAAE